MIQNEIKIDTTSTQTFHYFQTIVQNLQKSDPNQAKCVFGLFFGVVGRRVGERMPTLFGGTAQFSSFWQKMDAQGHIWGAIFGSKTLQNLCKIRYQKGIENDAKII